MGSCILGSERLTSCVLPMGGGWEHPEHSTVSASFQPLHALAVGPRSLWTVAPAFQYCSVLLLSEHVPGRHVDCRFSWSLDLPPLLAAWLLWLPQTTPFSCPHGPWEPRCGARDVSRCLGTAGLSCLAHWRGRIDENKAAEGRAFHSKRELLKSPRTHCVFPANVNKADKKDKKPDLD